MMMHAMLDYILCLNSECMCTYTSDASPVANYNKTLSQSTNEFKRIVYAKMGDFWLRQLRNKNPMQ